MTSSDFDLVKLWPFLMKKESNFCTFLQIYVWLFQQNMAGTLLGVRRTLSVNMTSMTLTLGIGSHFKGEKIAFFTLFSTNKAKIGMELIFVMSCEFFWNFSVFTCRSNMKCGTYMFLIALKAPPPLETKCVWSLWLLWALILQRFLRYFVYTYLGWSWSAVQIFGLIAVFLHFSLTPSLF